MTYMRLTPDRVDDLLPFDAELLGGDEPTLPERLQRQQARPGARLVRRALELLRLRRALLL